ncbi:NUDIX hydrolase [Tautonia rosea]|uniref:NUDIX hydrolase n=1 Tax=Tautonia rosea TaxID=2728037 RepID=UPI001472D2EF|nr:NUDIX hydrolase [Tautonia rosea]
MIEPWHVERSVVTYRDRWITLRSDDCRSPSGYPIAPYHVIELPTWLNIVALTQECQVVLVTEYRHGLREVLTSLPSGTVDPDDADVEAAARRELLEETGYGGGRFVCLGRHPANPANQNNEVVGFLAVGVDRLSEQKLDPSEEIAVSTEDFSEWLGKVCRMEARIQVSHVAAALMAARVVAEGHFTELNQLQTRLIRKRLLGSPYA